MNAAEDCIFHLRRRLDVRISIPLFILLSAFILYTFLLVFICSYVLLDDSTRLPQSKGKVVFRNLNDDYDVGCNGYSMDYRISEQKRILSSVRAELVDAAKRMDEVNRIYEDLNKKVPERQLELSSLEGEIASAQRTLMELRDRRNVPVFLPQRPLLGTRMADSEGDTKRNQQTSKSSKSLEDFFDFSLCSISSFMPLYITPSLATTNSLKANITQLLKQYGNVVPTEENACLAVSIVNSSTELFKKMTNHVIINLGHVGETRNIDTAITVQEMAERGSDYGLHLNIPAYDVDLWKSLQPILPYSRKYLFFYSGTTAQHPQMNSDIRRLLMAANRTSDKILTVNCDSSVGQEKAVCEDSESKESAMRESIFCVLLESDTIQRDFWIALRSACIPVILSLKQILPFQDTIDWRLAVLRLPLARFPELHFIIRSIPMSDILEMRRIGRQFFLSYLADQRALVRTLLASLQTRIGVIGRAAELVEADPLFNNSFAAPIQTPINAVVQMDDEYLGPLEGLVESPRYQHNFSSLHLYSHRSWNGMADVFASAEYLAYATDLPSETEFYPDSNIGFRPILPGSGVEFSQALGGNSPREQFTVVMLTYNRDAVLSASLERLFRMPYLNKVIVVWNNVGRQPIGAWPKLHVPVEFIKAPVNSLNNRFLPWDRIETEAVLSLDDDIDLRQSEIMLAFRVWRENRDRLVGFPARHHARYGDEMYYNSNHTCQLSMILTGAAFMHKSYLHSYSYSMPEAIRRHVDEVTNCEDIAMNFHIAHLTRKPPIKTTGKWTLRCPTCTEALSQDDSHFEERHQCIRLFTRIYGYNPLKFSQFRADSVLFKTRLPADKQKCFKYV